MFGWEREGGHPSLFIFYVYGSVWLRYFCCRGISRRWSRRQQQRLEMAAVTERLF